MTGQGANSSPEFMRSSDRVREGQEPVADNLRQSASLSTPEANAAIKAMTGADSKVPAAFAGKDDLAIVDKNNPKAADASHTVSGERTVDTVVGNDTRYSLTASDADANRAKYNANQKADVIG